MTSGRVSTLLLRSGARGVNVSKLTSNKKSLKSLDLGKFSPFRLRSRCQCFEAQTWAGRSRGHWFRAVATRFYGDGWRKSSTTEALKRSIELDDLDAEPRKDFTGVPFKHAHVTGPRIEDQFAASDLLLKVIRH